MRKTIAAVLGLPVIGASYLPSVARRPATLRLVAILFAGGLLTAAAAGTVTSPASAYKTAPGDPEAAVRSAAPVVTGYGVHQAVDVEFSAPMDASRVAAAVRIEPSAAFGLEWSTDGKSLAIIPADAWAPETFYTVTIGQGATDRAGVALRAPLTTVFVTRPRPTARLGLAGGSGTTAHPFTQLDVTFSTAVDRDSVAAALQVAPATDGVLLAVDENPGVARLASDGEPQRLSQRYRWVSKAPLAPGTAYVFTLAASVRDADGVTLAAPARLDMRILGRPAVIRSRPVNAARDVPLDQSISVRFSRAMDRASAQAAFHVGGFDVGRQGAFSWAEGDTVLIWNPGPLLRFGTIYAVTIAGTARATDGIAMGASAASAATFRFTTVNKPRPSQAPAPRPSGGGGGSSSSPWYGVETYFLSLINCTHTGGWVATSGVCSGRGSNGHAPMRISAGISNAVTRPWAKYLAQTSQLYHGCPGCRLAAAGYTGQWWGENLAWWSGDSYRGAVEAVLFFQNERPYGGGHWVNMMDARGRSAGVGVWRANGRTVYAIDFWGG